MSTLLIFHPISNQSPGKRKRKRNQETNMLNTMTMKEGYIGTWHTPLNPTAMLISRSLRTRVETDMYP